MSIWSKFDNAIEMARLCATGIQAIRDLITHYKKQDAKLPVVDMIEKIVDGVTDVLSDKRPLSEVRAEIIKLRDSLASEDAAADRAGDSELDKRFPKG